MGFRGAVRPLKILFVTPEVEPFAKVGGLADMCGALPKYLARAGHDVRLVAPCYGSLKRVGEWRAREEPLGVEVGPGAHWARTWETTLPGGAVPAYFLEFNDFFARPEIYSGGEDNAHRFVFLCRGALTLCEQLGWTPDVIHCHDWTTGLLPVMLNTTLRDSPLARCATVFTIHNLEHQGLSPKSVLPFGHIPWSEFRGDSTESYGAVNMMKAGLYHATKITTVSPTYAQEIRTKDGGFGLDHVLRFRSGDLIGILNGIDNELWNTATDPALPAHYSAADLTGKAACKAALQERMGLQADPRVPIYGVVARLAHQKGLDLLADVLGDIMGRLPVQFALLGSGDENVEDAFRWAAHAFPGRVAAKIGFDGKLARLIQAGADLFIMPSRSEPCGLTQMYAMRYGTPPIVRATGGLADTVWDYEGLEGGTGFIFHAANGASLYSAIGRSCAVYYDHPREFRAMQLRGMAQDFSWTRRAKNYEDTYRWAVEARTGVYPA